MMNLSGLSSSSRTSGRHNSLGRVSEGGEDAEQDSDWDSWDEDDEQQVRLIDLILFNVRYRQHHMGCIITSFCFIS